MNNDNLENNKNNLNDDNIKFSKRETKITKILEERPRKIIFDDDNEENKNVNKLINSKNVQYLNERQRKVIFDEEEDEKNNQINNKVKISDNEKEKKNIDK